jgi:UDP-glucose 4-epimerase
LAREILGESAPTIIARLTNLYGPGQDVTKTQGLISQLCLAAITRRPISIFVPMETLRDYLFADDAAEMIHSLVSTWLPRQPPHCIVRNLASERPDSIAAVLRIVQQVGRRHVRVALGSDRAVRYQRRDLRVVSMYRNEIVRPRVTPLPAGIKQVYDGLLSELQRPSTARGPRRPVWMSNP